MKRLLLEVTSSTDSDYCPLNYAVVPVNRALIRDIDRCRQAIHRLGGSFRQLESDSPTVAFYQDVDVKALTGKGKHERWTRVLPKADPGEGEGIECPRMVITAQGVAWSCYLKHANPLMTTCVVPYRYFFATPASKRAIKVGRRLAELLIFYPEVPGTTTKLPFPYSSLGSSNILAAVFDELYSTGFIAKAQAAFIREHNGFDVGVHNDAYTVTGPDGYVRTGDASILKEVLHEWEWDEEIRHETTQAKGLVGKP